MEKKAGERRCLPPPALRIRACCAIPGADAASGAEEAAKKTVIELDQPLDLVPAYALPMPCPVLI
eukprot:2888337-Rhodomonas_salina.5